jgi:hypothetical protein
VDFNDLVPEEDSPSEEPPLKLPRTSSGFGSGPEARVAEGVEATTSLSKSEPSVSPVLAPESAARFSIAAFEKSVGTSVASQLVSQPVNVTEQREASGNEASTKTAVKAPDLGGLAERLMRGGAEATAKAGSRVVRDSATAARYSKEHRLQRDCVAVMGAFRPVFGSRGAFVVANTHIYWCAFLSFSVCFPVGVVAVEGSTESRPIGCWQSLSPHLWMQLVSTCFEERQWLCRSDGVLSDIFVERRSV